MTGTQTQASDPEPTATGTTGLWSLHSASATVYYVDLDRRLLLRQPGGGSPRGATDGRWVPLVKLERLVVPTDGRAPYLQPTTAVAVGHRHHYLLDPGGPDHQWWIQRTVTRVELVTEADLPVPLPERAPADDPASAPHPGTVQRGVREGLADTGPVAGLLAEQRRAASEGE